MCRNVCATITPPVCPSSSLESGVVSESAGVALWERYYGLYDKFIRVACGGFGDVRIDNNGGGGLLLSAGSGGEGDDRECNVLPDSSCGICSCSQTIGCGLCGRKSIGDIHGFPKGKSDGIFEFQNGQSEQTDNSCDARGSNVDGSIESGVSSDSPDRERVLCDAPGLRDSEHVNSRNGAAENRKLPMRGPNFERNRLNREKKKDKKRKALLNNQDRGNFRSFFRDCDSGVQAELAKSRAARLIAENKYAVEKFERDLAIVKGLDSNSEIKKRNAATKASIERSMVSMEKAHATLVATGNVPTELGGFAATINSSSISPNSSASLAELRQCQKDLLDSRDKVERLTAALVNAGVEVPRGAATERENDRANDLWTDNTENMQYLDDNLSVFAVQRDYCGTGKMRICAG